MRISGIVFAGQGLVLAALLVTGACSRAGNAIPLQPPPTPPLSRPVIGYGVISAAFIHLMAEPGGDGASTGYLRKSSIVEVLERRAIARNGAWETWVLVRGTHRGWLREREIRVFDNEAQARTATGTQSNE
jgi:hypothetical protein